MAITRPYTAQSWENGDIITKEKLANIEAGLAAIDSEVTGARGSGASAGTLGKRIDDLVMVQDTQPTSEANEIWVRSTGNGVQVPTYEEFNEVKSAVLNDTIISEVWEYGAISYNNGHNVSSNAIIRTNSYVNDNIIMVKEHDNSFKLALYAWDVNDIYVGCYNGTSFINTATNYYKEFNINTLRKEFEGYNFKIVIFNQDDGTQEIDFESAINNTIFSVREFVTYEAYEKDMNSIIDNQLVSDSSNLVNLEALSEGYLSGSVLVQSANYRTTDYIKVLPNIDYVIHKDVTSLGGGASLVAIYDSNKSSVENLTATLITGQTEWFIFKTTNQNAFYMRITSHKNGVEAFYVGVGNSVLSYIPIYGKKYINDNVLIDYSQIYNVPAIKNYDYNSSLTGKHWYLIGDSATHGDFSGITQPNIDKGMYAGQLPVYPFFIGNRTGVLVHNLAQNGATLATISDQPTRYQWTADNHYKLVGSDADIITVWIGANDMWQNVPIGTIDSMDVTTFYGAYNTVLSYYVTTYPKAKLGIVASFWCTQPYAEAIIAIGAKYGVPVLNLYNDPSVPVTVGSKRPDVANSIKTERNNQWIVSTNNTHPSAEYHEIESFFIESWLKTL